MTPAHTRRSTSPTTLRIDTAAPFAVESALAVLAAHAIPDAEHVNRSACTVTRLLRLPSGPTQVTVTLFADHVAVTSDLATNEDRAAVLAITRHWFDLDSRPDQVDAALTQDPLLTPLVRARPGLRVISYPDGFEAAIAAVLGQQVSITTARTFIGRLLAAYGTPHPSGLALFPAPAVLAAAEVDQLRRHVGTTRARAYTLHTLARACRDGLTISPNCDHRQARRELASIPGIGPWTTEYLALRALGDRDACPSEDLVLRRALGVTTAVDARSRADAWSPYRSYGVLHLWTWAAYLGE